MNTKWMSSGCLRAAPEGSVDLERGIIEGVSVCTVGEAKGHDVNLDSGFIAWVADAGGAKRSGLKARFGHPNMCSTALGTFIGRFKNFRVEGDQALADLYLSNEAKDTPHGNLYDYVLGMARNEPDMFGTSIVFTPGRQYKRTNGEKIYAPDSEFKDSERIATWREWEDDDSPVYIEGVALHACDTVDEPAANDGLFSVFAKETIAGQITEFLDLNPQVWEAFDSNPSVLDALGRYPDQMDEFINRYREYREHSKESNMDTTEALAEADATEALAATEAENIEDTVADESAEAEAPEAMEDEAAETVDEAIVEAQDETEDEKDEPEALSREEFVAICDEFGADIAAQIVKDGGSYSDALRMYADGLKAENEKLRAELAEQHAASGTPAKVVEEKKVAKLFNTGK